MNSKQTLKVIAAVRNEEDFSCALSSDVELIFDLSPDLFSLSNRIKSAHQNNKKILIHIDLATGLGKDKSAIAFAKQLGVDGIISTRVNIIKAAKELGLLTVQRFFIVDSQSVQTTFETLKATRPDMIEIMPGVVSGVLKILKATTDVPVIAGGLIQTENDIKTALRSGASLVSTGKHLLWKKGEENV